MDPSLKLQWDPGFEPIIGGCAYAYQDFPRYRGKYSPDAKRGKRKETAYESTVTFATHYLDDLHMEKHAFSWNSGLLYKMFKQELKVLSPNKVFPADAKYPFPFPENEAEVSDAITLQLALPVRRLSEGWLPHGLIPRRFASLEMELRKERPSRKKSKFPLKTNAKRNVDAVRFDLILCMTPYFHDDHGVLNCYETEDTRKWLACGETFDDENLQGSTAMTLIEVKDYGKLDQGAFKRFAKRDISIGTSHGDLDGAEARTQGQIQQSMRYPSHYGTGNMMLTDSNEFAMMLSPYVVGTEDDEAPELPKGKDVIRLTYDDLLVHETMLNNELAKAQTAQLQGKTVPVKSEETLLRELLARLKERSASGAPNTQRVKWMFVDQNEVRRLLTYIMWLEFRMYKTTHKMLSLPERTEPPRRTKAIRQRLEDNPLLASPGTQNYGAANLPGHAHPPHTHAPQHTHSATQSYTPEQPHMTSHHTSQRETLQPSANARQQVASVDHYVIQPDARGRASRPRSNSVVRTHAVHPVVTTAPMAAYPSPAPHAALPLATASSSCRSHREMVPPPVHASAAGEPRREYVTRARSRSAMRPTALSPAAPPPAPLPAVASGSRRSKRDMAPPPPPQRP